MKNTILVLFAVIFIGLSSCKKDPETYCYACAEYEVTIQAGVIVDEIEIETTTYCGVQENQVYMFEHQLLLYRDSFTSIYSVKTCSKTEDAIPQNK